MGAAVRAGTVIAGFRVRSLIGEGAMGAVYLAEEVASGHRVALRLLAPELARDERFRQRFLRESQVALSLDHPHVVPTVAAGEEDGQLYLAMAHVEGPDLRQLLRREQRLDPERAPEVITQAGSGLDAAHEAGLVHRDVKPGNLLIAEDSGGEHVYVCDFRLAHHLSSGSNLTAEAGLVHGEVKPGNILMAEDSGGEYVYVCDFGLARHVSSVSSLTGERGFVGTIDYVPPEQIEGGTIDARADVYSLGCVLYECLAGERPFDRQSELAVVFAHLNEPPPRLSDLRPELPEAFDAVFTSALA